MKEALDLCCGAGGLSLGLMRAGFNVHGVDADEDALATHARHVGPCEQGDLRTWSPPHAFDLVAGGPPCQPFSQAGRGLALDDPRYLVPDFLRIAREASARAVLIENVRGLVQKPKAFRVVLDAVAAEYLVAWTVLDAADYGVPQHRDRLFIVGFKDPTARARFRWPLATHAPRGDIFGRPPYRTVREALGLDVERGDERLDQPAPCVTATEHKSAMGGTQPLSRRRRASERLLAPLDRPAPTIKANTWHEDTSERASQRKGGELLKALEAAGLADRPAPSSQGDPRLAVAGHHDRQQNGAVKLTQDQLAILQGFPAGWEWTGKTLESQYRQIGNAVPPALAEAVGRALHEALHG